MRRKVGKWRGAVELLLVLAILLGMGILEFVNFQQLPLQVESLRHRPVAFTDKTPKDVIWDAGTYLEMDPMDVDGYLRSEGFSWEDNRTYFRETRGTDSRGEVEVWFCSQPGTYDVSALQDIAASSNSAVQGVGLRLRVSGEVDLPSGELLSDATASDLLSELGDVKITSGGVSSENEEHVERAAAGILRKDGYSYACWCTASTGDVREDGEHVIQIGVESQSNFKKEFGREIIEPNCVEAVLRRLSTNW